MLQLVRYLGACKRQPGVVALARYCAAQLLAR